ncbi:dipeptide epimerase [Aestuariibaculum lutulentum]|uniref:Dipeptide epimerase n=1 Tax=Aestuariibaculum lutulentum TaxID=2920935 RepID=A0ABS9RH27_9FLAO|nr:dipeptide epimerase [Aestuariibaculum lutulentum]MCH4552246.1 dipeptide epimerase [Aestuariibaculum lutulentum]
MNLQLKAFDLKLKHTFTISRESHDIQPSLIVKLSSKGFTGYGEATSNPYYGITIDKLIKDITDVKPFIESLDGVSPEEFWQSIYSKLKHNMFAICALDMAYNDLYARLQGKMLYELWDYDISNNPLTNYTIGIDTVDKMVAKMQEMPWPIYKIKLGTKDDIKIVEALRKNTNAVFRVDANCGWQVEETLKNAKALKQLGVEFIEQPLPAKDWDAHKEVYSKSVLPIIADESCQVEADVLKCHNHFHGVNVKLVKCGGLTSAKRMLLEARSLGMKTMVGCMTESSVGISAIAHLLPLLDFVDMDGALLLSEDIAEGVTITDGVVTYSDLNGIGVKLI